MKKIKIILSMSLMTLLLTGCTLFLPVDSTPKNANNVDIKKEVVESNSAIKESDNIITGGFSIDMPYPEIKDTTSINEDTSNEEKEILNAISPTLEHFLKGVSSVDYKTYSKEQILDTHRDYYDKTLLTDEVVDIMIDSIIETKLIVEFNSYKILEINKCSDSMIQFYGEGDYYLVTTQLDSTTVNKVEGKITTNQMKDSSFYKILMGKKDGWKIYDFQPLTPKE